MGGAAALGTVAFGSHAQAARSARWHLKSIVRTIGDASGALCPTWYSGTVLALVPGRRLTPLFHFEGNQVSRWQFKSDTVCRKVGRTVSIYRDLKSGKRLREFKNPYTGKTVEVGTNRFIDSVYHYTTEGIWMGEEPENVLYGPELSLPWTLDGAESRVVCDRPYRDTFGFPFGESRIFRFDAADLENEQISAIPNQLSSSSTLPWPSWMKMGDREGVTLYHAAGRKLRSVDDYPRELRRATEQVMPDFYSGPDVSP